MSRSTRGRMRRGRALSLSLMIATVMVIVFLVVVAMQWRDNTIVRVVTVQGCTAIEAGEVLDLAAIPLDSLRFDDINFEDVEERVEQHPFVHSAALMSNGADELSLRIKERVPAAYLLDNEGALHFLDQAGEVLAYRFTSQTYDIPVLSGFDGPDGFDHGALESALALGLSLRLAGDHIYGGISEIRREDNGDLTLISVDGATPVLLGANGTDAAQVQKLTAWWRTPERRDSTVKFDYIDLRWNGQVVVKTRRGRGA